MPDYVDTRLVIRPNASLSWTQAKRVIAGVTLFAAGMGGYFTELGLWPMLLFLALAIAALAAGLVASVGKNGYREVLDFSDHVIRVRVGLTRSSAVEIVLQRPQTRVLLEQGPYRNSPSRLVLSCKEQRLEIARCVTDEERAALSQRIKQLIHPGWVRPGQVAAQAVAPWDRV